MLIFLLSRKFHAGFGLVGSSASTNDDAACEALLQQYELDVFLPDVSNQCDAAKKMACRRGWEW